MRDYACGIGEVMSWGASDEDEMLCALGLPSSMLIFERRRSWVVRPSVFVMIPHVFKKLQHTEPGSFK